jgi:transcriptional regulator with XRE-family HTH domain
LALLAATRQPGAPLVCRVALSGPRCVHYRGTDCRASITLQVIIAVKEDFAARLRWWRERRALSQLDLANEAEISQRHLSFLELGRAAPSREMVLRLADALAVPFREQNTLLLAAGFAPVWREQRLDSPEASALHHALDLILAQQEPYPGFVLDRRWHLLRTNRAGRQFVRFLTGDSTFEVDSQRPVNLADALLAPDALRPLIGNWQDVALYFIRTVRGDALADRSDATAALLARLLRYPDVAAFARSAFMEQPQDPVLTMAIRKGDVAMRLFTTLAVFGTPLEVTAEEVRIESFFPADEATAVLFRVWAEGVHS